MTEPLAVAPKTWNIPFIEAAECDSNSWPVPSLASPVFQNSMSTVAEGFTRDWHSVCTWPLAICLVCRDSVTYLTELKGIPICWSRFPPPLVLKPEDLAFEVVCVFRLCLYHRFFGLRGPPCVVDKRTGFYEPCTGRMVIALRHLPHWSVPRESTAWPSYSHRTFFFRHKVQALGVRLYVNWH